MAPRHVRCSGSSTPALPVIDLRRGDRGRFARLPAESDDLQGDPVPVPGVLAQWPDLPHRAVGSLGSESATENRRARGATALATARWRQTPSGVDRGAATVGRPFAAQSSQRPDIASRALADEKRAPSSEYRLLESLCLECCNRLERQAPARPLGALVPRSVQPFDKLPG
jgi:hypothetical protein